MIHIYEISSASYYSSKTAKSIAAANTEIVKHNSDVAQLKYRRDTLREQFFTMSATAAAIVSGLDALRAAELAAAFKTAELLARKETLRELTYEERQAEHTRLCGVEVETRARIEANIRASGAGIHFLPAAINDAPEVRTIRQTIEGLRGADGTELEADRRAQGELKALMERKKKELFG